MGKAADRLGKVMEAGINGSPHVGGGHVQRAVYQGHEGRLYVDTQHAARKAVLEENARRRSMVGPRSPKDFDHLGGDMMFTIPLDDWDALMAKCPNYYAMDQRQKRRFWEKQRQLHPEWFIG